jgi:hypothetical protein
VTGPSSGTEEFRILEVLSRREPIRSSSAALVADAEIRRLVDRRALRGLVDEDAAELHEDVELWR